VDPQRLPPGQEQAAAARPEPCAGGRPSPNRCPVKRSARSVRQLREVPSRRHGPASTRCAAQGRCSQGKFECGHRWGSDRSARCSRPRARRQWLDKAVWTLEPRRPALLEGSIQVSAPGWVRWTGRGVSRDRFRLQAKRPYGGFEPDRAVPIERLTLSGCSPPKNWGARIAQRAALAAQAVLARTWGLAPTANASPTVDGYHSALDNSVQVLFGDSPGRPGACRALGPFRAPRGQ